MLSTLPSLWFQNTDELDAATSSQSKVMDNINNISVSEQLHTDKTR